MASRAQTQQANDNNFVPIGVTDSNGNPFYKSIGDQPLRAAANPATPGGGGGGDGVKPLWRLDVVRDVQIAKWGLATLIVVFGAVFMSFLSEFKDVRKDISSVQASVAAQAATTAGIQTTLTRIEDKLDSKNADTKGSAGSKSDPGIYSGAGGSRPRRSFLMALSN